MSFLIPEWAPNIHPMLVHFPIALLIGAAVLNLFEIFLPGDWWDEQKSTVLYAAGAVSAIVVYFTGQSAADQVFLETGAQPVLSEHADLAFWTVWYFGIYVAVRAVLHRLQWLQRKGIRLLAFTAVLPGLFLLYETGDHGAKLVFGYGTGTGQLVQQPSEIPADSLTADVLATFNEEDNGNWRWPMGPDAVGTLLSRFRWLQGRPGELEPNAVRMGEDNYFLEIGLLKKGENLFVTDQTYQNIQLDCYLDLGAFEGEIEVVHHLQDSVNYDFVRLSTSGEIVQGRRAGDEYTVFEESTFTPDQEIFVRVVSDGNHFRAYVDRQLKVHGHGTPPPPGSVGIGMNGSGKILIDSIELTQL